MDMGDRGEPLLGAVCVAAASSAAKGVFCWAAPGLLSIGVLPQSTDHHHVTRSPLKAAFATALFSNYMD